MGGTSTAGNPPRNTLSKEERLTSKKLMDELFKKGSSIVLEPIRLVSMEVISPTSSVQVLFSVPKKSFPRAVDRNRIKRLLRESYRLHKHDLYNHLKKTDKAIVLSLIYSGEKIPSYKEVEDKIIVVLNRLIKSN